MKFSPRLELPIVSPERRNAFARNGLRRAALAHFKTFPGLTLTAADAAARFQLSEALCERLLAELAARGHLRRTAAGSYIRPERPAASA
jgi:hypothetical protein